ncbi:MAG: hypothetical protein H7Y11_11015 [Armatimonadetes bacterium]|nr:hypothetical protein [Anaerolineae bacterium]
MATQKPVYAFVVKRHTSFQSKQNASSFNKFNNPWCYVGSVAMFANELYAESLAQLPYVVMIPAHYV